MVGSSKEPSTCFKIIETVATSQLLKFPLLSLNTIKYAKRLVIAIIKFSNDRNVDLTIR
jgi:hypothetical protein